MSNKVSVHKNRHKKRLPCFSSCFSSSFIEESKYSESTSDSREKASQFCSSSSKKKKKTVPIQTNVSMKSTLARQGDKEELHEPKRNKARSKNQQTASPPKISLKYQTRSQQDGSQNSKNNTVRTVPRTEPLGSIEQNRSIIPADALNWPSKLNPLIALSILGVTLASMVVFGRAYAVVCLCVCFYLLPLLKTTTIAEYEKNKEKKSSSLKLDLESKEYKKSVVLQGLLERNGWRN